MKALPMSKVICGLAIIGAGCAALAVLAHRRHLRSEAATPGRAAQWRGECEVSECSPDGVPLSLYAG